MSQLHEKDWEKTNLTPNSFYRPSSSLFFYLVIFYALYIKVQPKVMQTSAVCDEI